MNHLTDEILNEYLDNELADRAQVEEHLAVCADCTARLAPLQALFNEIESLTDVTFSRDIREALPLDAARFTRDRILLAPLPRSLRLAVTLQAAFALVAFIFAAPFVRQFLAPYVSSLQPPSLADIFLQVRIQWTSWLDIFTRFQFPALPEIPVLEISNLFVTLTLTGVFILWLVGNGLLLRNKIK